MKTVYNTDNKEIHPMKRNSTAMMMEMMAMRMMMRASFDGK